MAFEQHKYSFNKIRLGMLAGISLLIIGLMVVGLHWFMTESASRSSNYKDNSDTNHQFLQVNYTKPTPLAVPGAFPCAVLPWKRDISSPVPITIPIARVPRIGLLSTPDSVDVPLALVPFAAIEQSGKTVFVTIPPHRLVAAKANTGDFLIKQQKTIALDPRHPLPVSMATAMVPFAAAEQSGRTLFVTVPLDRLTTPILSSSKAPQRPVTLTTASVPFAAMTSGGRTTFLTRSPSTDASTVTLRDPTHPVPVALPVAVVPYAAVAQSSNIVYVTFPLDTLALATNPRLTAHPETVDIPTATVPFTHVEHDGHPQYVSLPLNTSGTIRELHLRNPLQPSRVFVATAEVSFVDPSLKRSRPALNPLASSDRKDQDKFIVALAQDQRGRIWIGTEDEGVWCWDPSAEEGQQWKGFTTKQGLGDDNAYAITVDRLGRVWVGHLNHGVSVYNGQYWQNYDVLDGPLGERVFAMTSSPVDGDVWIATSAGLTRYSYKHDTWSNYTRADGLPSDHAKSLAFDQGGTLYVGTQCDGIVIGQAKDDYKVWRVVTGPEKMPTTPKGEGLPTNLINQVLVTHDGTVYAATTTGLAWSKNQGQTWQYTRGQDWANKVRGLYGGPPKGWNETEGADMLEDYLTCLAEDEAGMLWVGTRQKGYEVIEPRSNIHQFGTTNDSGRGSSYVSALLPRNRLPTLIGQYQGGLLESSTYFGLGLSQNKSSILSFNDYSESSLFPSRARKSTLKELASIYHDIKYLPPSPDAKNIQIFTLADDWRTQGTWIDRYGRYFAILAAMGGGGNDFISGYQASVFSHRAWLGNNHNNKDQLRYWVHTIATEEKRSLQNVQQGGRKQSEWDDHGEAYPLAHAGPNVFCTVSLPAGQYVLSLYFFNKDGHTGANRIRDYVVRIRHTPMPFLLFDKLGLPNADAEECFKQSGIGATSRVVDFWGGVWKKFYINSPTDTRITVQIDRNYSLNAIISGVFIDPVSDMVQFSSPQQITPNNLQGSKAILASSRKTFAKSVRSPFLPNVENDLPSDPKDMAWCLLDSLLVLRDSQPGWYLKNSRQYLLTCLRVLCSADTELNDTYSYYGHNYVKSDRQQDLAAILNDLSYYNTGEYIYINPKCYNSYAWEGRTKAGRVGKSWSWNWLEFKKYLSSKGINGGNVIVPSILR